MNANFHDIHWKVVSQGHRFFTLLILAGQGPLWHKPPLAKSKNVTLCVCHVFGGLWCVRTRGKEEDAQKNRTYFGSWSWSYRLHAIFATHVPSESLDAREIRVKTRKYMPGWLVVWRKSSKTRMWNLDPDHKHVPVPRATVTRNDTLGHFILALSFEKSHDNQWNKK